MKYNYTFIKLPFLIAAAIIILGIGFSEMKAGNLGNLKLSLWLRDDVEWGDDREIEVEGENLNTEFAVTGIKVKWGLLDFGTLETVYEDEKDVDDVQPSTKFKFNIGKLQWSKLKIGYSYTFNLELTADFDEDPSNNKISTNFNVISPFITRKEAGNIIKGYLSSNHSKTELKNINVFIPQQVTPVGTMIKYDRTPSLDFTTDKAYWLGYVNFNKYFLYSHQSSFVKIDAVTGDYETIKTRWWPKIGMRYYPDADQEKNDLIYGTAPEYQTWNEEDWIYKIDNNPQPADSTCFIIITGHGQNARDSSAFVRSGKVIKQEFSNESRGPKLPVDRFAEINDPTVEQLLTELEKLKNNYNKVFFYYVGHGDSTNGMVFKDGTVSYLDIFGLFKDYNISNQCYIFDCCYSGLAIDDLKNVDGWDSNSITIVTSSRKDTTAVLQNYELKQKDGRIVRTGVGAFTNSIAICFGDSTADRNKNGKTSIAEAAEWARKRNPTILPDGTKLNDLGPQIFTHERHATKSAGNINFDDSDIRFAINDGLEGDQIIKVTLNRGMYQFAQPQEDGIYEASTGRLWDIGLENNGNEAFSVDIKFRYNSTWDNIESNEGIPGVISRENDESPWMPHYPTEYNEENMTFTARSVIKFSQWALARVAGPSSKKDLADLGVFVENYPNPFVDAAYLRINLERTSKVVLSIFDTEGRRLIDLADNQYNAGTYRFIFNGSKLADGVYFAKLTINGKTEMLKLIHFK